MEARPQIKTATCLGCGKPLPPQRLGPNPHRVYHEETCRDLHRHDLAAFEKQHPELPGQGRSPVQRPGTEDRLRVVHTDDRRLATRFEVGPAKKAVQEHHDTDTLPISYYLDARATVEDAAAFLRQQYPDAEVLA